MPRAPILETRLATESEVDKVVEISAAVQHKLTASGSLQEIGPLEHIRVASAAEKQNCFVLAEDTKLVGCALVTLIRNDYYSAAVSTFASFPAPWHYLHSVMLEPASQGRGVGAQFMKDVLSILSSREGTVLLDCWAGSEKLRHFYEQVGLYFVAVVPKGGFEVAVFAQLKNPAAMEN